MEIFLGTGQKMKISQKLKIFSWSMYDFANTIFAMNVISLYFALWVTVDKGGEDILYSCALSSSMLLTPICLVSCGEYGNEITSYFKKLLAG